MTTQCGICGRIRRQLVVNGLGSRRPAIDRQGFTYIESMLALAILSLAGAAILTSVAGAVTSSNDLLYRSIGTGLAEQLLDEIAAAKFPNGIATTLIPMPTRNAFTTIDDYSGWSECPPRTKAGEVLGNDNGLAATGGSMVMTTGTITGRAVDLQAAPGFVNRFTRSVLVERVQPGPTGWTVGTLHTPHRRVTVLVSYTASNKPARVVAQATRVFSFLAQAP